MSESKTPADLNPHWVHMTLQSKGGVGKSYLSVVLAQYHRQRQKPLYCIDTDPLNQTFARYLDLNVETLDLLQNRQIHAATFDLMIDRILQNPDSDVVVDNGASCFVSLLHYLSTQRIFQFLNEECGRPVAIHAILTGGQAGPETLDGLHQLLRTFRFSDRLHCVVWLNPFWGPVNPGGVPFEKTAIYNENRHRISEIIALDPQPDIVNETLLAMTSAHLTFDETQDKGNWTFMAKRRIRQYEADVYGLIDHMLERLGQYAAGTLGQPLPAAAAAHAAAEEAAAEEAAALE